MIDYLIYQFSGRYRSKLLDHLKPLHDAFNINYFFYLYVRNDFKASFVGTNPDLIHHYLDEKMHLSQPFITNARDVKSGIYLYDSIQNSKCKLDLDQITLKYDAKHACMLTNKDETGVHIYGFSNPCTHHSSKYLILNHSALIRKFISVFEDNMENVLNEVRASTIDLGITKSHVVQNYKFIPEMEIIPQKKKQFVSFLGLSQEMEALERLTKSEKKCLYYLLEGFSARQISEKLSLSRRTIETYVNAMKFKLDCENKWEILARYSELKNLDLLD